MGLLPFGLIYALQRIEAIEHKQHTAQAKRDVQQRGSDGPPGESVPGPAAWWRLRSGLIDWGSAPVHQELEQTGGWARRRVFSQSPLLSSVTFHFFVAEAPTGIYSPGLRRRHNVFVAK